MGTPFFFSIGGLVLFLAAPCFVVSFFPSINTRALPIRFDSIDCIVFNPKAALGTTRGQRHPSPFDLIQIHLSAEE